MKLLMTPFVVSVLRNLVCVCGGGFNSGVDGDWLPLYGCDHEEHATRETLKTLLIVECVDVWREPATVMA